MIDTLAENGTVTEVMCGPDLTYLLEDSALFLQTEYKVLQNQTAACFVQCMRMLNNGRVQLYYAAGRYRALSALMDGLNARRVLSVGLSLLAGVLEVRNNGFLECQNLLVCPERIFVDTADWKVKLIYVPLGRHQYDSYSAFEQTLRETLLRLVSQPEVQLLPEVAGMARDLAGGRVSLEEIYRKYREQPQEPARPAPDPAAHRPGLRIVSMNQRAPFDLQVTKNQFVVSREPGFDGTIPFADTISAPHCKFIWDGSQYTVTDMDSLNGTFLNREPLTAQKPAPLKNGDMLRLADWDFQVVIG